MTNESLSSSLLSECLSEISRHHSLSRNSQSRDQSPFRPESPFYTASESPVTENLGPFKTVSPFQVENLRTRRDSVGKLDGTEADVYDDILHGLSVSMYSPPIAPTPSMFSALSPQNKNLAQRSPTSIIRLSDGSDFPGESVEDDGMPKSDDISANLPDQKHLEKVNHVGKCVKALRQDGSRLENRKHPIVDSSKRAVVQEDTSRKRVACPKCDHFRGRPSEVK